MSIGPWRPWHELANARSEMLRNIFSGFGEMVPRIDVYQTEGAVVATVELPGVVSRDDVEITATEDTLTIQGEIRRTEEGKDPNYFHSERFYGNFSRTVGLPAQVQPEKATATYKNGILDIRIPRAANQRQRRIPIELH